MVVAMFFTLFVCWLTLREVGKCNEKLDKLYRKPALWHRQCLKNISKMGYFSSDRSIEDYAKDIWDLKKTK